MILNNANDIINLLHYAYIFTTIISLGSNFFLIYLILTKSPKTLGVYKYLMVFICIFEILYSILDVFLKPMHYSHLSVAVVLVNLDGKLFGPSIIRFLHYVYWGFFGASLAIFAIHFVYRYLVVTNSKLLASFNSWKLIGWLLLPILNGIVWMLIGFYLCAPSPEITEMLREPLNKTSGDNVDRFDYVGFYLYETRNESLWPHLEGFVGMSTMTACVVCIFAVILYFGIKTYSRIRHLARTATVASLKTQALQSQLFYALVVQTLIPFALLQCPVAILCLFALFNNGKGMYSVIASLCVSIYPAIDAFPNFFIISPYRRVIFSCFNLCRKKVEVSRPNCSLQTGMIFSKQHSSTVL